MNSNSINEGIDYYLGLSYSYKVTPDPELGYFVEIIELPGCFGDGKTIPEAIADADESKILWLETALDSGYPVPTPNEEHKYSGQFLLRMPKSLHRAIAQEAAWENVSMNQYLNVLITENRHIRATSLSRERPIELDGMTKDLSLQIEKWGRITLDEFQLNPSPGDRPVSVTQTRDAA